MVNWRQRSYTKDQFIEAWNTSFYFTEVLEKLNVNKSGGSIRTIKEAALELNLSFDDFYSTIQGKSGKKIPLSEILVKNSSYKGDLKKRLYEEDLKTEECERCNLSEWMGSKLTMTIDHIDGDNKNNEITNLTILCPNCHSQTPTWCGRNKVRVYLKRAELFFCLCGKKILKANFSCNDCRKSQERFDYPNTQELIEGVERLGYLQYAKTLGISDNGLRKLLRRRGIEDLPKRKR